jgi:hypothetical protein
MRLDGDFHDCLPFCLVGLNKEFASLSGWIVDREKRPDSLFAELVSRLALPVAPADQTAGMGRTGITSTDSPGKIVKCGWFSKSFAAASFDSARTTVKAPISLLMSSIPR